MARFKGLSEAEYSVLHDSLMEASKLDPDEDDSFPPLVEAAEELFAELVQDHEEEHGA